MKTAMNPALLVSLSIAYLLTSLSCLIASAPSLLVPTEDVNLEGVKFIVLLKKKREKKKGSVISHTQILGSYWEVKWKIFYFYLCFLSCHGSIKLWKQHRPLLHECLTETILIWIPCLCRRSKNNYCTSNFWSINYYHSNLKLLTFITFSHFISSLCTSKCC